MDPRFQNLAKPSDIVEIKNELEKLCSEESGQAATAKPEIQLKNEFKQNPQRKSGILLKKPSSNERNIVLFLPF